MLLAGRPARRQVKLTRARVARMVIKGDAVELLLLLPDTDLDCRNAIHQALKRGKDLALGYETGEDAPVYEAEKRHAGP